MGLKKGATKIGIERQEAAIWYAIEVAIEQLQDASHHISGDRRPIAELDIYRAAKLLIDQYAEDAPLQAAQR